MANEVKFKTLYPFRTEIKVNGLVVGYLERAGGAIYVNVPRDLSRPLHWFDVVPVACFKTYLRGAGPMKRTKEWVTKVFGAMTVAEIKEAVKTQSPAALAESL